MPSLNLMVHISSNDISEIIRHCVEETPNEACGLLIGRGDVINSVRRARSQIPSPFEFTMESKDILTIDQEADTEGLEIVGLYHSHTMTEAYPSPTDVAACPDDRWFHILISLKERPYKVSAFRIVDRSIEEVTISLSGGGDRSQGDLWTL
ncbi:MAG: M67 family metallopeptidase [Actinomycetota bacterium]|nr:M67 family metallopeptidase [Actinomycetota bacterium]